MTHRIEIEISDGRVRRETLTESVYIVGRDLRSDIRINAPSISRRHARLSLADDRVTVEDLGTRNGTFINGDRITGPEVLRAGDMLRFGSVSARYLVDTPIGRRTVSGLREALTMQPTVALPRATSVARGFAARGDWRARMLLSMLAITLVFVVMTALALWWAGRDDWVAEAVPVMKAFAAGNREAMESSGRVLPTGAQVLGDGRVGEPVVLAVDGEIVWPASRAGSRWEDFPDPAPETQAPIQVLGATNLDADRVLVLTPIVSMGEVVGWVGAAWQPDRGISGADVSWLAWLFFVGVVLAATAQRIANVSVTGPLQRMVKEARRQVPSGQLDLAVPREVPELVDLIDTVRDLIETGPADAATEPSARQIEIERWFSGIPLPIVLADLRYRVVAMTPEARRVLGFRGAMTDGTNLQELLPGTIAPVVFNNLERLEPGKTTRIELDRTPGSDGPVTAYLGRAGLAADYAFAIVFMQFFGEERESPTISSATRKKSSEK